MIFSFINFGLLASISYKQKVPSATTSRELLDIQTHFRLKLAVGVLPTMWQFTKFHFVSVSIGMIVEVWFLHGNSDRPKNQNILY